MRKQAFNPYLPSWEYIPDGEPHVFDGRIYLYGSHDRFGSAGFCLNDYVCWSADVHDLTDWRYEGVIYRKDKDPVNQDIPADAPEQPLLFGIEPKKPEDLNPRGVHAMWAPDVAKGPDGRYYLYYCLDFLPQIRVAVCDTPAGKYEYYGMVRHRDGQILGEAEGDLIQFDPGVFCEGDEIYLYSGNAPIKPEQDSGKQASQVMRLEPDMLTLKEEPRRLLPSVTESAGTGFEGHEFFEASSIRKISGLYYFVYSSVKSSEMCYAVSEYPDRGYRFGGTLIDIGDIGYNGRTAEKAVNPLGNTHGGIECCGGQWYVFYHRQTDRTNFSRQGCAEKIFINEDGSIDQAEVTSCGLNPGPLEGTGIYPARICCHLTGKNGAVSSHPMAMKEDYPYLTQDVSDLEPDSPEAESDAVCPVQYVTNVQDGDKIGYKYFRFDGTGAKKIFIRIRGNAEGAVKVSQSLNGEPCGTVKISVQNEGWTEIPGDISPKAGITPLYFEYVGNGRIDIQQFTLSGADEKTEKNLKELTGEMTLEEKASFCSGYYYWHTKGLERMDIPRVMMCDGPHGLRKQVGAEDHLGLNDSVTAVCFPSASALAASFDREIMEKLGKCLGRECQAENVGMLLGPGVNMKRSPLCGRNFEYFSEDPYLAGELAAAYVKSFQAEGVAACVKHFVCNNQETNRMSGDSEVDERTLREIYLPAFERVVKDAKVRSVMCAYNALNGTFCAENKNLLTKILRDEWGFDGFVVTDWGAVKDRVTGMEAGVDLEMPGGPGAQDEKIVRAVREGRLKERILDETVERILTFIRDSVEQKHAAQWDYSGDHRKAVEIAEECIVLLENRDKILPLRKKTSTVFIGEFARAPRYQGGGSSHVNPWKVTGAYDEAREMGADVTFVQGYRTDDTGDAEALIREAVQAAKSAGAAVIFAGLPDAYESEGKDRETLGMPEAQNRLIEAVADVQPDTVVVLHAGAPVAMPWRDKVKAVLFSYLCGEGAGEAQAHILYGEVNPSGKLAETFPLCLEQNPSYLNFPDTDGVTEYREGVFIGYRYYDKKALDVAYPFGYGLSYTEFEYSNIRLDREKMKDTDTLTVTCTVKNTGNRAGREQRSVF